MKIQIDKNLYLTGGYCTVGSLNESIDMKSLPDDEPKYFPAYQLLSREESKIVVIQKEVIKERTIMVPVLDENGEPTGETEEKIEEYTEIEDVEQEIFNTVYYYKLDQNKKEEIDMLILNPPKAEPTETEEIQEQLTDVQLAICNIYEKLKGES